MLAKNRLELSTENTSDSTVFCFEFTAGFPAKGEVVPNRTLVLRDHDRVAMALRNLNGDIYSYFTDGLMIAIDHRHPGSFIMVTAGYPEGHYTSDVRGTVTTYWGFDRDDSQHRIMVAFGEDLGHLLGLTEYASYDRQSNCYTLKTRRSVTKLTLNPPGNQTLFPVKESVDTTSHHYTLRFSFISSNEIPLGYRGLMANVGTIRNALANSGAPILDITKEDPIAVEHYIVNAFAMPRDLGSDPRERAAISTLEKILMLNGDATRPSAEQ